MSSKAINKLNKIIKNLEKSVQEGIKANSMKGIGEYARDLVVKRTRLGYGVDENFKPRRKLEALSKYYIELRKENSKLQKKQAKIDARISAGKKVRKKSAGIFKGLDATTKPNKSNLTWTGTLLRSLEVSTRKGEVTIIPDNKKHNEDNFTNRQLAEWLATPRQKRRIFNRVSRLEFRQIVRFYEKSFGDLLKRLQLIK